MHPQVNIAVNAARAAGDIIAKALDRLDKVKIHEKAPCDLVTQIDHIAEHAIIEAIRAAYPQHKILSEEAGLVNPTQSDTTWIIDPLDGTMNFIHGFPQVSISIAIQVNGDTQHGVIYDPITQDLYTATRGSGAQLNGKRIRVSNCVRIEQALIGTAFPSRQKNTLDEYLTVFKPMFLQCSDIRRSGSAALDLAYIASGKLDGFWQSNLQIWDMAAGALMVQEAGGFVGDFQGNHEYLTTGCIVAGTRKIYPIMQRIIQNP